MNNPLKRIDDVEVSVNNRELSSVTLRRGAASIIDLIVLQLLAVVAIPIGGIPLTVVVALPYLVVTLALFDGVTLGKRFMGLRVVRTDGSPVGLPTVFGREMFKWTLIGFLKWWWPMVPLFLRSLFSWPSGTMWHDRIVGTRVERIRD